MGTLYGTSTISYYITTGLVILAYMFEICIKEIVLLEKLYGSFIGFKILPMGSNIYSMTG